MTWAEFKQSMESQGVSDDMKVYSIYWAEFYKTEPEVEIKDEGASFGVRSRVQ